MDDEQALHELNTQIGEKENRGDAAWLATILAPKLAFQRANPEQTVDDAAAFLHKAPTEKAMGAKDRTTRIEGIQLFGETAARIAVVTCVVTTGGRDYRNVRLWVKRDDAKAGEPPWRLLGWANAATD